MDRIAHEARRLRETDWKKVAERLSEGWGLVKIRRVGGEQRRLSEKASEM
jgi:hypothetical protein